MRHPIEKYNQNQADVLAGLPDEQREWMARLFRIGNASYCYYNRVNELSVFGQTQSTLTIETVDTAEDLLDWLERQLVQQNNGGSGRELLAVYFEEYIAGLPSDSIRHAERARGLDDARRGFPFRRYVLERHDMGMDEYLRLHLSAEDYAFHKECGKPLNNDTPAR